LKNLVLKQKAENDQLFQQNERLKGQITRQNDRHFDLVLENERLKKELEGRIKLQQLKEERKDIALRFNRERWVKGFSGSPSKFPIEPPPNSPSLPSLHLSKSPSIPRSERVVREKLLKVKKQILTFSLDLLLVA